MNTEELIKKYPSLEGKDEIFNILEKISTVESIVGTLLDTLNEEIKKYPVLEEELDTAKAIWGGYDEASVGYWLKTEVDSDYLND